MADRTLPWDGGCRCGKLRFRISASPLMTMACHCTGCQKMSASAYSLSMAIPSDGFEVIAGEPVIGGIHGDQAQHNHCDYCKSWVFTRPTFTTDFVNVRPTMLDNTTSYVPFMQTYMSEALPWATTPARHSFDKFPEMEEFGGLIAEFAEQQRNPD